MYNISATDGTLNLSMNELFKKISNANDNAQERIQTERFHRGKLLELAESYQEKLQLELDNLSGGGHYLYIKSLFVEIHPMLNRSNPIVMLEFGHGRAYVRIEFKMDSNWEIKGSVRYSGIDTFESTETEVESVAQIIEFCQRPIQLLIIGAYVKDYEEAKKLEQELIDPKYKK